MRSSNLVTIGLLCVALGACDRAALDRDSMIEGAKNAVRERMRDPTSVEFRSVVVGGNPDSGAVCGEVNGRNGFGGYHGYVRFVATVSYRNVFPVIEPEAGDDTLSNLWAKDCPKS